MGSWMIRRMDGWMRKTIGWREEVENENINSF